MDRSPRLVLAALLLGLGAVPPAHGQSSFLNKPLPDWLGELGSARAEVRRSAAFALGKMGGQAYQAVRPLVARLKDDRDPGVRDAAASALGDIVTDSGGANRNLWQEAGWALEDALRNDPSPNVRRSAAYALGAFGPQAVPALPALRKALERRGGEASEEAAWAGVRQNAAWAIGRLGKAGGDGVKDLGKLLTDEDALVRRDAAGALGALGKPAGQAGVRPLLALVKAEPDEVVRKAALDALARLAGPEHREWADNLYPLLHDQDPEVVQAAALTLANIGGEPAGEAVPVLRQLLKDADPETQATAAAALAKVGPPAYAAVPDLARILTTSSRPQALRRNAALALGHIGAKKSNPTDDAVAAIKKDGVPALVRAMKSSEPDEVRRLAAQALSEITYPANKEALPDVLAVLGKDRDPDVRQRCVWSLFQIGPDSLSASGADKVLLGVLDETGRDTTLVRYDAAQLLAYLLRERAPDKVADVLLDMLTNKSLRVFNGTDSNVRGGSSETSRSGSDVRDDLGGDARYMAAEALGALGPKSRAAGRDGVLNALRAAARDRDPRLAQAAEKALGRLGK